MAQVVPLNRTNKPRTAAPAGSNQTTFPYSIRLPADHLRTMQEIVESPDYPDYRTKADVMIAAIDSFLTNFYIANPGAPGARRFQLERRLALRSQRDAEMNLADKAFITFRDEKDISSMTKLLVVVLEMKTRFTAEEASPTEMETLDRLHGLIQQKLTDWQ